MSFVLLFFFYEQAVVLDHRSFEKIFLFYEMFSNRAAYDAACYEAKRSTCCTKRARSRDSEFLKHRAERARGSVSAYHRYRACTQSDQRIYVKQLRQTDCKEILRQYKDDDKSQEHYQRSSSVSQDLEIRLKSNRRKEEHHADFF